MNTRTSYNRLIAVFVLTLALVFLSKPVRAQTLPLQAAPARQEIHVDPGQKTAINVRFMNTGDFPVTGNLRVADFIVDDDSGTPRLLDRLDQPSPRFSASQWITLPNDTMTIAAHDKVEIQATVHVPADSRPGGRYVAVYFEPITDTRISGTSKEAVSAVSERLAALTYFRVNGPINEKALVSDIFAPIFQEYGPVQVKAEILNRGDYHITPLGSFTLRNMLGGLVDQKKLKQSNIFPDVSRSFTDSVGHKWMIGKYTVTVLAAYGSTGQVIERNIDVWVFPWKIALAILLGIIIIILIIKGGYKKIIYKENMLEEQLKKEHDALESLKAQLPQK